MTTPSDESAADRLNDLAQQVYDEQESNARATAGQGPRDDEQADELADEAANEGSGESSST